MLGCLACTSKGACCAVQSRLNILVNILCFDGGVVQFSFLGFHMYLRFHKNGGIFSMLVVKLKAV